MTGSAGPGRWLGTAAAVLPGALLATALTAWRFSSQPLWRDEWITWSVTARPWESMADLLSHRDGGLWLLYALVRAWTDLGRAIGVDLSVTSLSVAWLRLPAAMATVLAVAATALVGRRVGGPLAGVLAGALLAVTPALVDHAQEARAYPEVVAAVTLTALPALRCREPGTTRRWVVLASLPAGIVSAALIGVGASQVGLVLTDDPGGWTTGPGCC